MKKKFMWTLLSMLMGVGVSEGQVVCTSKVLPEPTHLQETRLDHHYFYAPAPSPTERWGHIEYPIVLTYPPGATSVGLMYLMAKTPIVEGWDARALWGYTWVRDTDKFVIGQSGALYPYVRNGITFVWYPVLAGSVFQWPHEPTDKYRVTIDNGDEKGIDTALSTVLHTGEGVSLGVNVKAHYPEPILTYVSLHYRECRP